MNLFQLSFQDSLVSLNLFLLYFPFMIFSRIIMIKKNLLDPLSVCTTYKKSPRMLFCRNITYSTTIHNVSESDQSTENGK